MSLFGAMFSGVSGLKTQGTAIGVISDNISNLNTVGYKGSTTQFLTLVNNAPGTISYNPGGALAQVRQDVDRQGLLQATDSPTDVALSGAGFFVVNPQPDASGQVQYTRAGSFRQDNIGNFVNAAGQYLQGWPLDRDGRLPGEPGNLNTTPFSTLASMETVNVEFSNGVAAATTTVDIGANLDARTEIFPGAGRLVSFATGNNQNLAASEIIVPAGGLATGDIITATLSSGQIHSFQYGGIANSVDVTATPIFGANTTTQTFFAPSAGPTGAAADFNISLNGGSNITFTYNDVPSSVPNQRGFNNLDSLAAAIDNHPELTARIDGNQLFVASLDAQETVAFTDGGATGWNAALGGTFAAAAPQIGAAVTTRFNSLQTLSDQVNLKDGISSILVGATGQAQLTIRSDDPLGTVQFTDDTAGPPANATAVLEMGLVIDTDPTAGFIITSTFGPEYDPTVATTNMAGTNTTAGAIQPQFTRNIRIFDSLGAGHNMSMSFIKVATNTWATEIYAADAEDVNGTLTGKQVARGNIVFNGDGTLRSVDTSLITPATINWTNGALASQVEFNFGTAGLPAGTTNATFIGLSDGLSQFSSDNNVAFVNQNGAEVGSLISVNISDEGFVIANFTNGESQSLYRLPIADFQNPIGLESKSGNVWTETQEAGPVNLRFAGTNGVGTVVSGVLENSNVELADELTDMIIAQRAYQSNAKVITTTDELLEELNRI